MSLEVEAVHQAVLVRATLNLLARSSNDNPSHPHQCIAIAAQSVAGFANRVARIDAIVAVYLKGRSQCLLERGRRMFSPVTRSYAESILIV